MRGLPAATILLGGCTQGPLSALSPAGPGSEGIAHISWVMLIGFLLVWALVMLLAGYAVAHRRRGKAPIRSLLIGGGLIFPSTVLLALLIYGIESGKALLPLPIAGAQQPYRVDVRAHQWWWEVRHTELGDGVRTVNEIHIPAGVPVDVHVSTEDVIHSFWAPRLGGKIDAIPGRTNIIRLQADQPGNYYGVCAEFCGSQHAHMQFVIHALEAAAWQDWADRQGQAEPTQSTDAAQPRTQESPAP